MAERPECTINRVARGLVEQISNHAATYPYLWREVPRTLRRGAHGDLEMLPRPAVVVTSQGPRGPEGAATLGSTREQVRIMVMLGTRDTADPEGAIEDLLADVKRALDANRRLAGLDSTGPILPNGYIEIGPAEVGVAADTSGDGGAEFPVLVTYQWNQTDSP